VLEQGDIFFFYRPKVEAEEVSGLEDVQRFYMVMAPEGGMYRLFVIGQKQLPGIEKGGSTPEERSWALNVLTTSNPDDIREKLLAEEYGTKTRGRRRVPAATPAGEGKYCIVSHGGDHTELAYVLELPELPGPTQQEFEIKKEAGYIIAVKNPDVAGGPGFERGEKPRYTAEMMKKFAGGRRWIDAEPEMLDYENTQVLLIGARERGVQDELGITLVDKSEAESAARLFSELKLRKKEVPTRPLEKGRRRGGRQEKEWRLASGSRAEA
ncbi:MAG: hypothetical protein AB1753_09290, partial [Thermoproteota archaeon]